MNYIKDQSELDDLNANHFVHLRDAKTESPIFCIHPSGGDVGIYRKLGRNLRCQTTIAIQSKMMFGSPNEFDTIEKMAQVYAELIDQYQPTGPIRLLGFSFGGFIANKMVKHLERLQREVGFFGVIDSDLRWVFDLEAVRENLFSRMQQISQNLQNAGLVLKMSPEKLKVDIEALADLCLAGLEPDGIAEELRSRGHTPRSDSDSIKFQSFIVRFTAHCRMIQEFQPSAMEVPIHCWWPTEGNEEHELRCQCWRDLALSGISESTIEGSHYSIMKIPCVKAIASEMSSALAVSEQRQTLASNQPLRNEA